MESKTKELVKAGHELVVLLGNQHGMLDAASLVQRLTAQLDITAIVLREKSKQCDQLAAENAALKKAEPAPFSKLMMEALDAYQSGADDVPELAMLSAYTKLRDGIKTPTTDAWQHEQMARGVEKFAAKCSSKSKQAISSDTRDSWWLCGEHASDFAAQLRNGEAV